MRYARILFTLVMVLSLSGIAYAMTDLQIAEQNFKRAVDAENTGDSAAAQEYYAASAKAWESHMAGAERVFTSDLVQAGISFYKAGMFEKAATTLEEAIVRDKYNYQPYVYAGLAYARLGMPDKAKRIWDSTPPAAMPRELCPTFYGRLDALNKKMTDVNTAGMVIEEKCNEYNGRMPMGEDLTGGGSEPGKPGRSTPDPQDSGQPGGQSGGPQ